MTPIFCIVIALLTSAIATIVIMPWFLGLCHKLQLTYTSDNQHKFRIPRIGGTVMAPAMSIGLSAYIALTLHYGTIADSIKSSTIFIATGMMIVYLIGILDDIFKLSPWQKRLFLLCVSITFPLCNLCINNLYGFCGIDDIPFGWAFFLTVATTYITVKAINAFNDCDGLAGGLCLVALVIFSVLYLHLGCFSYASTAAAMSGTLIVYLYYNIFGDERIGTKTYMGHAGSLTLSFCIIYLALKYAMNNTNIMGTHRDGLLLPYSMFWLAIFDYIRVLFVTCWHGYDRKRRRQEHIHHRIISKGVSEHKAAFLTILFNTAVMACNLLLHHTLNLSLTTIVITDIIVYTIVIIAINHGTAKVKPSIIKTPEAGQYHGKPGLVSVIMATWNSEEFVAESIDSILAQTYTNWELIITDDCSTDGTMDILNRYAASDSRIHILQNETNGGAGVSRNNSIASAQGQYIAFCDSDDRWVPKKLEKQLAFMNSHDVALCFAPYYTCDANSQYLGYVSAPQRVNLFQMMCDNKIGFLTCIYDTKVLGKHFMPKQRKRQDHAMLLNLLKECKSAYSVPEPLAHYRIHVGNISGKKISLLKYNAHTYTAVFGWPKALSYAFLFTFFLPTYFTKRVKNILLTIARAASN